MSLSDASGIAAIQSGSIKMHIGLQIQLLLNVAMTLYQSLLDSCICMESLTMSIASFPKKTEQAMCALDE